MKDYTEYTDEELVELLRQGDTDVMDYLLEKYKFIVRQKARVLYLAGGEADDLIQEGMIGLFKAIRDYRGDKEASFYTFAQLCVDRQMYIDHPDHSKHKCQCKHNIVPVDFNKSSRCAHIKRNL